MKLMTAALILLATAPSIYAADQFTYQHQPVHPDCITNLIEQSDKQPSISLKACTDIKKNVRTDNGYITTQDETSQNQQEFSRYTIIGSKNNRFLIDTASWTGGSGIFTSVIWVELLDDQLTLLKALAGGDRCNGGTSKAGDWEYSVNETPYDMLSRAGSEAPIKAYDEIESSAASCVAQSIYRFNPSNETSSFILMQINDEALPIDHYVKEIKYQPCFNNIYNEWIKRGKHTLNRSEVKRFRDEFDKICLNNQR